jgi:hypothetical protein
MINMRTVKMNKWIRNEIKYFIVNEGMRERCYKKKAFIRNVERN